MKAISLWQPWAQWVALGWKTIETRNHYRFKYLEGQRVAIHAAKFWDSDALEIAATWLNPMQVIACRSLIILDGAIIATAQVDKVEGLKGTRDEMIKALCNTTGRVGLYLGDIVLLKRFVPFRGLPWIFQAPDELINE